MFMLRRSLCLKVTEIHYLRRRLCLVLLLGVCERNYICDTKLRGGAFSGRNWLYDRNPILYYV